MTPEEVAAATATPVGALGRSYFFSDVVRETMAESGFTGLPGYVGARGGVLGDVDSDVVVSAFALFSPAVIEMGWNQTKEQGSPSDAAAAFAVGLYAGWRAMPVPDDPAAGTALALQILRELRFGFHIHALSAVGMAPVDAVVAQSGPQQAQLFGWSEPLPDPEPLKAVHRQAEEITSARMNEVYEAIDASQRAHVAATVGAIAEIALN